MTALRSVWDAYLLEARKILARCGRVRLVGMSDIHSRGAVVLPRPSKPVRLFYIDDSGTVDTGWIVYSWVECAIPDWSVGIGDWVAFRKEIFARHLISVPYELHATRFMGGKGSPSAKPDWNSHKRNRSEVLQAGLAAIAASPVLLVGTVCRRTTAKGSAYFAERGRVYAELVTHVNHRLGAAGEAGILVMDGRPVGSYYEAHRALRRSTRSIVEDPFFVEAHRSQWIQMADMTAWTAYQYLNGQERRHYAKDWYQDHLLGSDVNGGPLTL